MKTYIDHFEIESQRPCEKWEHVGNCYPEYRWRIWRPWYYLWLRKRKAILNEAYAWTSLFQRLCRENAPDPTSPGETRLVIWMRYGTELVRVGAMKPC